MFLSHWHFDFSKSDTKRQINGKWRQIISIKGDAIEIIGSRISNSS